MPRSWPLTGRQEELAFVTETLRRPEGAVGVVLAGAAGVGKTRLAREALVTLSRRGVTPEWVTATASARTLPLGAFARLVPASGPDTPDPAVVLQRLSGALATASRSGLVVGVDDAHLLDELSATLVHQLAISAHVPLVVTVRSGEPTPDAVTALWKDGHLTRIEVPPLPEDETATLVEAVLGGPIESHSARRLYAASRGNVLFLRQLVDGAVGNGDLRRSGGVWQWHRRSAVTPQLAELVDARIGRLAPELHAVVEILAFGEPLGVPLLNRLTDPAAVAEAERTGLVTVEPDGRRVEARLAHPLYTEVIRGRTSTLRARHLRRRLARALAATGARRTGDLLRRAVLELDGDADPSPDLFTEAARQALALYDVHLSERLARAALAAGAGPAAAAVLGHALSWLCRAGEAEEVLAPLVHSAATDQQRALAAIPWAANRFWTLGRARDGEHALRELLDTVSDESCRASLRAMGTCFAMLRNRPLDAIAEASELLSGGGDEESPRPAGSDEENPRSTGDGEAQPLLWAAVALSHSLAAVGRATDAVAVTGTYLDVIDRHPDQGFHRGTLRLAETTALRLAGRLGEAERAAHQDIRLSTSATWAVHLAGLMRGQVALDLGQPATAVRWCTEAVAGLAGRDPADWSFVTLLTLTQAHGMLGQTGAARRALAQAEAAARDSAALYRPDLLLARAWTAAAEGAASAARQAARQAATVAAGAGQSAVEVVALHTAVCFGDRTVTGRLTELSSAVDGVRAGAAVAHAAALASGDAAGLDAASRRLEQMGALLLAADAAAQAAAAHHRQGRRSPGIASAARAARLAEACGRASTPALRAAALPLPLTGREREIASLAASGLSNRQIAERLTVSVRTVEGHIYRSCIKLDAPNRGALIALLRAAAGSRGDELVTPAPPPAGRLPRSARRVPRR